MSIEPSREIRTKYIPTLDGWRCFAILLVLVDHSGDSIIRPLIVSAGFSMTNESFTLLKELIGNAGVHLFFGLSGYLITNNLLSEERARGAISLRAFYLRRLFRIQPASITVLLVLAILAYFKVILLTPLGFVSSLLGFANFTAGSQTWYTGHFWSLAVEEQFYIVWPLIFITLKKERRLQLTVVIAVIDAAWRIISFKWQIATSWNYSGRTDIQAEWLLWGCVLALSGNHKIYFQISRLLSLPLIILTALLWISFSIAGPFLQLNWKVLQLVTSAAAITTPLMFAATAKYANSCLGRVLEFSSIRWIGKISYSLYLWQQLFVVWLSARSAAMRDFQDTPNNFLLALIFAGASYYLIEQPFIALGKKLIVSAQTVR